MGSLRHIRLISFDLDGTLLRPEGTLGERTIAVLRALVRQGIHVVLNSGRSPNSVADFATQLSLEGPQISLNGAAILKDGQLIASTPIPLMLKDRLIDILHEHGLIPLYLGEHFCAHPELPGPEWQRWTYAWGYESMIDLDAFGDRPLLHLQGLGSAAQTKAATEAISLEFGDYIEAWSFPSWFHGPHAVDLCAKGTNKGSGLRQVAALYDVPMESTLACGDWLNDLPMFKVAGAAVAMVQAIDVVRDAATHVTEKSHAEEGLAAFLSKHWEVE
jgi:Cof subfamily protein (haloacid dehalogenase superfamily)